MNNWLLVIGAVLLAVAAFVFLPDEHELLEGEIVQTGNIEISDSLTYKHEVLYPKMFSVLPNVTIKLTKGSANIEVVEQRVDGFVFKSSSLGYSVAEGAHVEWTATGLLNEY